MSDSSSDTDSSGGWTIISNEDIEKMQPKVETVSVKSHEEDVQKQADRVSPGVSTLEKIQQEELIKETFLETEAAGKMVEVEAEMLSSGSDISDNGTVESSGKESLGMWEGPEEEWVEPNSEVLDLGTSAIRQQAMSTSETMFSMVPPFGGSSSSENDVKGQPPSPAVRRRRGKKVGGCGHSEGEGETPGQQRKQEREPQEEEEQQGAGPHVASLIQGRVIGSFRLCILLIIIIAICLGLGYIYYSTVQFQQRQKALDRIRVKDLSDMGGDHLPSQRAREAIVVNKEKRNHGTGDPQEKCGMSPPIGDSMKQKTERNLQLQCEFQKEDFRLKQLAEERGKVGLSVQRKKRQLRSMLDCEEKSVSILQEELRNVRRQIRNLEWKMADSESSLLEEHQHRRSFLGIREVLMAEAQVLHGELEREQRITALLKEQLRQPQDRVSGLQGMGDPDTEELHARLAGLERRLNFERQRSDLWHRLYVEGMDVKETEVKSYGIKASKDSETGKIKDMLGAAKNSSRELMHRQKAQVKKAKEAIKENVLKLDMLVPVMQSLMKMNKSLLGKENLKLGKNILIPEVKVHICLEQAVHPAGTSKGCSTVFVYAYQESKSLFNKPLSPIQVDEFSQLIHSYLQQHVGHFHHWKELENTISSFFHNGLFIHDQMLFTDFVSGLEDFLKNLVDYKCLKKNVFEDLDEYVYKHFFGDTSARWFGPSGSTEWPALKGKEQSISEYDKGLVQTYPDPQKDRKWTRPRHVRGKHLQSVKTELDATLLYAKR